MSTTPSSTGTKRSRSTRDAGTTSAPDIEPKRRTRRKADAAAQTVVPAEQRHAMIAEAAYRRAELRGFQGGDAVQDWLESEREVDALLARSAD